jgi:hypothetical protein
MVNSQLEILEQGRLYLNSISTAAYNEVFPDHFISSPGAHIRHVLDHYQAIMIGVQNNVINYDLRSRGGEIEQNPGLANEKTMQIMQWLKRLTPADFERSIHLMTAISVHESKVETIPTSLARELLFASSHAVHHYAMVAQIAKHQKVTLPQRFGIAPATATYLRQLSTGT